MGQVTPTMSKHARERCIEMGISTKVAKHIVRRSSVVRPGKPGSGLLVAVSDEYPDYAVVFQEPVLEGGRPIVATVLFRTVEDYERSGETFIVVENRALSA